MATNHEIQPEIWLRPTENTPLSVLLWLVNTEQLTATPRMGARSDAHEKGYRPGQVCMLKVFDNENEECVNRMIMVKNVIIKELTSVNARDLVGAAPYTSWQEIRRDLESYEQREMERGEIISIVVFSYLVKTRLAE
jgi:hypothetical protein